jgi:hypothetical protein
MAMIVSMLIYSDSILASPDFLSVRLCPLSWFCSQFDFVASLLALAYSVAGAC